MSYDTFIWSWFVMTILTSCYSVFFSARNAVIMAELFAAKRGKMSLPEMLVVVLMSVAISVVMVLYGLSHDWRFIVIALVPLCSWAAGKAVVHYSEANKKIAVTLEHNCEASGCVRMPNAVRHYE